MRKMRPVVFQASVALASMVFLGACQDRPERTATTPAPESDRPAAPEDLPDARFTEAAEEAPALRARAHSLLREGRPEAAEPLLVRLWTEGRDQQARTDGVLLAALRARAGRFEDAVAVLDEAERRDEMRDSTPDIAAAIAMNSPNPAMNAARVSRQAASLSTAARASLVARLYERAGQTRDAIPFWQVALRRAPDEPVYARELARLYAITGRTESLESVLRILIELKPMDRTARINLVRLLGRTNRTEEAISMAFPPEDKLSGADRQVFAGAVLYRARLPDAAKDAFEQALKRNADDCEARWGVARVMLEATDTRQGAKPMFALVENRVGGQPCHVAESVRTLLGGKNGPRRRKRLERMARKGKSADPATLQGVLDAARRAR